MLEQTGQSIILYAHYTVDGVGEPGLTVLANVWHVTTAGEVTRILTDSAAFEVKASGGAGLGLYGIRIASALDGDYVGTFHTEDADVDYQDLPSLMMVGRAGVDHLDVDVSKAGIGSGDIEWDYTVYADNEETVPLEGVLVWLTSDEFAVPGPQYSNAEGKTTWRLFAGTYNVWRQKAGYLFSNPDSEEVSA